MTNPTDKDPPAPAENQREAIADSSRRSSEDQPRSYDERNTTEKVVHINPPDPHSDGSIQGIDPKQ